VKSGFKSLRKLSSPEDIRSPSTLANRAQSDGRLVLFARNQAAEQRVDSSNEQAVRVPTAVSMKEVEPWRFSFDKPSFFSSSQDVAP
jgi:hypothetical protein